MNVNTYKKIIKKTKVWYRNDSLIKIYWLISFDETIEKYSNEKKYNVKKIKRTLNNNNKKKLK